MILEINNIPVCVINLHKRPERLQRTEIQLNNFYGSESFKYYLVEGVVNTRPMVGIASSHMNCVEVAKESNWEYVCIVEDDVNFQSINSRLHADKCFNDVPNDFDILLGGVYTGQPIKHNEYWSTIKEFSGLHYYIVRNTCYDRILSFNKNKHIDRWLGNERGCNLKCYVPNEFFAIQHEGFSDNTNQDTNYNHLLNKFKLLK